MDYGRGPRYVLDYDGHLIGPVHPYARFEVHVHDFSPGIQTGLDQSLLVIAVVGR